MRLCVIYYYLYSCITFRSHSLLVTHRKILVSYSKINIKIVMKTKMLLLAACSFVLASCGGGNKPQNTESADTAAHDHMHDTTVAKTDTTAIKEGQEVFFVNLKTVKRLKSG